MTSTRLATRTLVTALFACLAAASLFAQRGGGMPMQVPDRLDLFTQTFSLDDAQKKEVKQIMDAAYKGAAPLRDQLKKTRTALGAAVQAGRTAREIDDAVQAYAAQAAAMAEAEAVALAKVLAVLKPDQRAAEPVVTTAVYAMRGALSGKKWDTTPDVRFY